MCRDNFEKNSRIVQYSLSLPISHQRTSAPTIKLSYQTNFEFWCDRNSEHFSDLCWFQPAAAVCDELENILNYAIETKFLSQNFLSLNLLQLNLIYGNVRRNKQTTEVKSDKNKKKKKGWRKKGHLRSEIQTFKDSKHANILKVIFSVAEKKGEKSHLPCWDNIFIVNNKIWRKIDKETSVWHGQERKRDRFQSVDCLRRIMAAWKLEVSSKSKFLSLSNQLEI